MSAYIIPIGTELSVSRAERRSWKPHTTKKRLEFKYYHHRGIGPKAAFVFEHGTWLLLVAPSKVSTHHPNDGFVVEEPALAERLGVELEDVIYSLALDLDTPGPQSKHLIVPIDGDGFGEHTKSVDGKRIVDVIEDDEVAFKETTYRVTKVSRYR